MPQPEEVMAVDRKILCGLLFITSMVVFVAGSEEGRAYFFRQPSNMTVNAGDPEVIIQCHIKNFEGDVMWSKDGFAFSKPNNSPFPRYSFVQTGQHQGLRIVNIQPEDDGEYNCQASTKFVRLRSRNARLTVLVAPQSLEISPMNSGLINVQENKHVTIECRASDARPTAIVTWSVGINNEEPNAHNSQATSPETKLATTTSSITMSPTRSDNGTILRCFARNSATSTPVSTEGILNVLYAPQQPAIDTHASDTLRAGEEAIMTCTSVGGNPLPTLIWKIGGNVINRAFTRSGTTVTSQLRHLVRPQDHGKTVTCAASSLALYIPLTTSVTLNVHYAPASVDIVQHPREGAIENTTLTLSCTATKSNPPSVLTWLKNEGPIVENGNGIIVSTVSFRSSIRTSLTLSSVKRANANDIYTCKAEVPELAFVKMTKVPLKILFPPTSVHLIMHHPKPVAGVVTNLEAGQTVQLLCQSQGGRPTPTLTWTKNGNPVADDGRKTRILPGTTVCREIGSNCNILEIVLDETDNLAEYACLATHVASRTPKRSTMTLQVLFLARALTVEQSPESLASDEAVSFICETSSSNPASAITWYRDGSLISTAKVEKLTTRDGRNGGMISNSRIRFIPNYTFNGARITCRAENPILRKSTEKSLTMNVEFSPRFAKKIFRFAATEGKREIEIFIPVRGNPSNMTYLWSRLIPSQRNSAIGQLILAPTRTPEKDEVPIWRTVALANDHRITWSENEGILRIRNVHLSDAGMYQLKAINTRGESSINVLFSVYYAPRISDLSGPKTVVIGDDVIMTCTIDSLPLTTNVQWIKNIPNPERLVYDVTTKPGTSRLMIRNVTQSDRGTYRCIAANGVGTAGTSEFKLSIKFGAVIDRRNTPIKVARPPPTGVRKRVAIVCRAFGNPDVTFQWKDENGTVIHAGSAQSFDTQYVSEFRRHDHDLFSSTLYINVAHLKGGFYVTKFTCDVTNSLGFDRTYISIVPMGVPDTPTELRITNHTFDAITVAWRPAFDGGKKQSFVLQYKKSQQSSGEQKERTTWQQAVIPGGITSHSMLGLEPKTSYLVRIHANNSFGFSHPTDYIIATTTAEYDSSTSAAGMSIILVIVISASCGLALMIVVAASMCCFKRNNVSYVKRANRSPGQCSRNSGTMASDQGTLVSTCRSKGSRSASPPSHRSGGSGKSQDSVSNSSNECGDNRADGHMRKNQKSFSRTSRDSTLTCKNYANYEAEVRAGFRQLTSSASFQHDTKPAFARRQYTTDCRMSGRPRRANSVSSIDYREDVERYCSEINGREFSVPLCRHGVSWDATCDQCKLERFERTGLRSSARGAETLNHCSSKRYTGKPRGYYTMRQQSTRSKLSDHTLYPIHDADSCHYVNEPNCQANFLHEIGENVPLGSYPVTSTSSMARHPFTQTVAEISPIQHANVSAPAPAENLYQSRDLAALYAVNVQAGMAIQANSNSGGLYVLGLEESQVRPSRPSYPEITTPEESDSDTRHRVSFRKDCVPADELEKDVTIDTSSVPPLSVRLGITTSGAACVRNSWISSSSSMSDYQQNQKDQQFYTDSGVEVSMGFKPSPGSSKNGSLSNHDDIACTSDKSSVMSMSSSASSTKPLLPNSCVGKRSGPSPPLNFRDSPGKANDNELQKSAFLLQCSAGKRPQEDMETENLLNSGLNVEHNVAFLGVDDDGTLFI
nr:nephrin [Ciona intestinalis]|eukprot:XP_002122747.1 nephrin [Ciona intestinalis]